MYANIAIQLVTFVSVGLKVVKSGGNIWGEEYMSVFFGKRVSTPTRPDGQDWEWSGLGMVRTGNGTGLYKSILLNT